MLKKTGIKGRHSNAFLDSEDVNPMTYISNLSDIMLVLAVGIMLALVVAWNVDIINSVPGDIDSMKDAEIVEESGDMQSIDDADSLEDYGLDEYGKVYIDKDGNFYVLPADAG